MADEINDQLLSVMRQVFGDYTLQLDDTLTADDVDGWDSLTHINLIVAIEKKFGIKFAVAEMGSLKEPGENIGTLKELLARKLKSKR